jgi:hypothetical protein
MERPTHTSADVKHFSPFPSLSNPHALISRQPFAAFLEIRPRQEAAG